MKSLAVSIALALTLSAPALAMTGPNPPAPADAGLIDESLILDAATPEDRAALLRRCAGPPPRPMASTDKPKLTPVPEPAATAQKAEGGSHSGGGD
jgi:hypothetical protein